MRLSDIKAEIKKKERTVKDLVRFINTKNDKNPNYCLLLGAGCSVSSGVRSGGDLIKTWKKELFEEHNDNDSYKKEQLEEYFTKGNTPWYDSRNAYASLFEKKYDLPRQRRMFIEKEVAGRNPSLGYAYLVKLIEDFYFRTIFTTNFDDLINEAFYLFSGERPIVCAHDSSISSITVTSQRPKIIKLHGDYLFDDIKSTLRETETLEVNIKNKFSEFAKDYGLIVVGYAGNDRSVYDIICYLLKQENCFNHGIYWCIRNEDIISEELRKLLWKEKVYFVEIAGFDELFCELHGNLRDADLPIETSILSEKRNSMIDNLLNNEYIKESTSLVLKEAIDKLKEQKNELFTNDLLNSTYLNENDLEPDKSDNTKNKYSCNKPYHSNTYKVADKLILLRLQETLARKKFAEVIKLTDKLLLNKVEKEYEQEIYAFRARSFIGMNKFDDAKYNLEKLIELDKYGIINYINLSIIEDDYNKKLEILAKALEINPYNYKIYYHKASVQYQIINKTITAESKLTISTVIETLEKSISYYPCKGNPSYGLMIDIYISKSQDDPEYINEADKIINYLSAQNPYNINTVTMKVDIFLHKKNDKTKKYLSLLNDNVYEIISDAKLHHYNDNILDFDMLLLNTAYDLRDEAMVNKILLDYDEKYKDNDEYLVIKAKIQIDMFNNLGESNLLLEKAIKLSDEKPYNRILFSQYLYSNQLEKAYVILETKFPEYWDLFADYYEVAGNEDKAFEYLEKDYKTKGTFKDLIVKKSYLLLRKKSYRQVIEFLRPFLEICNFNDPYLVINYELAKKMIGRKVKEDRLSRIQLIENTPIIKAAIEILKGNKSECLKILKEIIEKKNGDKYFLRNWPLFEDLKDHAEFKLLMYSTS